MNLKPIGASLAQTLILLLVMVPPMWVKATGTVVYLETEKMDPRSLFRGDYVILGYRLAQGILSEADQRSPEHRRKPVYVTVTTDRPARFVRYTFSPPDPEPGQACLVGRVRGWNGSVDFPQIAQFFVPEGTGRQIERARGENLLAKVATSSRCNAVLLGLEPR